MAVSRHCRGRGRGVFELAVAEIDRILLSLRERGLLRLSRAAPEASTR